MDNEEEALDVQRGVAMSDVDVARLRALLAAPHDNSGGYHARDCSTCAKQARAALDALPTLLDQLAQAREEIAAWRKAVRPCAEHNPKDWPDSVFLGSEHPCAVCYLKDMHEQLAQARAALEQGRRFAADVAFWSLTYCRAGAAKDALDEYIAAFKRSLPPTAGAPQS